MASNKTKEYVKIRGHEVNALGGYFTSNGTTTVITTVKGTGFSVTRSNTGIFTITLSATYPGLVGLAVSQLMTNTIPAHPSQLYSSTVSATNTITLTNVTVTSGTPSALEVDTGVGVSFVGLFYNSSLTT